MKYEGCHPCSTCKYYRKAVVKAIPWWELTDSIINVLIPICIHSAHELAIMRCSNYEASELIKELAEKSDELRNFIEKIKKGGIV